MNTVKLLNKQKTTRELYKNEKEEYDIKIVLCHPKSGGKTYVVKDKKSGNIDEILMCKKCALHNVNLSKE